MKSSINKKIFTGILVILLSIAFGAIAFCALFTRDSNGILDEYQLAYAAEEGATAPMVNVSIVAANCNDEELPLDDVTYVFNISDYTKWSSTSTVNKNESIFNLLSLQVEISQYQYAKRTTYYAGATTTSGLADNFNPNPATAYPYVQACTALKSFMDVNKDLQDGSPITVTPTAIYITGYTWYGKKLTAYNILEDGGTNLEAGKYEIVSVSADYSFSYVYTTSEDWAAYNAVATSSTSSTFDTPVYVSGETSDTQVISSELTYTLSKPISLFLQADVTFGSAMSGYIDSNLGLNLAYDSETDFEKNIQLSSSGKDASTIGDSNYFYFSENDPDNKLMQVGYGVLSSQNASSFGANTEVYNGQTVADLLRFVWYRDASLAVPCAYQDEDDEWVSNTKNAGNYFLRIESIRDLESVYVYNDGSKDLYALNFKYSGNNYVQEIFVDRKTLFVDYANGLGLTYGGSTAFNGQYTEAQIFFSQINTYLSASSNTAIYSGSYYEYDEENDEYSLTADTKFTNSKNYYIYQIPLGTSITDAYAKTSDKKNLWLSVGGTETDWSYVQTANELFNLQGSYLPGVDIKSYDYAVLYISVGVSELASNYTVEIGEYVDGVWKSYDTEENDDNSNLIYSGLDKTGAYTQKAYKIVGSFTVTPPSIDVDLSKFKEDGQSSYYGEVWNSTEIDFSKVDLGGTILSDVDLDGDKTFNDQTYDLQTSDPNWRIRVISSTSQREVVGNYNYIFVLMQISKITDTKGEEDYVDSMGTAYSPYTQTLYYGEYYVTFSLSYMLKDDKSATAVKGCSDGTYVVSVGEGANAKNIVSVRLESPGTYMINKIKVYLNLTDYNQDKYYDGTDEVKKSDGVSRAVAEVKQESIDGYVISPYVENLGYASILAYDMANYILPQYDIYYASDKANENEQDILGLLEFTGREGANVDVVYSILSGYEIDPDLRENDQTGAIKGYIHHRMLDLRVLEDPDRITDATDPDYSRMDYNRGYKSETYVAIRVAKYDDVNSQGVTLLSLYQKNASHPSITAGKEYYADYYYLYNHKKYTEGYYYYADLPGIFQNECYILLEIVGESDKENYGFLNGTRKEDFAWDTTASDVYPFNMAGGAYVLVDSTEFIEWDNALMENSLTGVYESVEFNVESNAGIYTLSTITTMCLANYKIILDTSDLDGYVDGKNIGMEITKIALLPESVFEILAESEDIGRILKYDKTDKLPVIYTSDSNKSFISISSHADYTNISADPTYIQADGSLNFMSLIKVIGFSVGGETEDPSDDKVYKESEFTTDINNMRLAGLYELEISSPETQNYKKVTMQLTVENGLALRVWRANVSVYATAAIRTYMAEYNENMEVKPDLSENGQVIMTAQELAQYVAYMDINSFELYPTEVDGYLMSYVYYKDDDISSGLYDTSCVRLYYVGFAPGDDFDDNVDTRASVTIDNSVFYSDGKYVDSAGKVSGAVVISGASKQNYNFNYYNGDLYVKKQTLILEIYENQNASYVGDNLTPEFDVYNEIGDSAPAKLSQFIAAYYAYADGKYTIYVRDFENNTLVQAQMSTGPSEEQTKDYYYYFEEYYDENDLPIVVNRVGAELFMESNGVNIKVYASGSSYFYYPNNDSDNGKNTIRKVEIYVYTDGNNHYYYANNDTTTSPIYLARNVEPDFNHESSANKVSYVDIIDGKYVYIGINEDDKASTLNRDVKNVFYDDYGNVGGYILKVNASPSEAAGGSSTNYASTKTQVVFFTVDVLEIELMDIGSFSIDGTYINNVWTTQYNDSSYEIRSIDKYYKGITLTGQDVSLYSGWATTELSYTIDGIPMYSYMKSEEDYASGMESIFAQYENGVYANSLGTFYKATAKEDVIENAGLYVILAKATINDIVQMGEDVVNMRNNIRFKSSSSQANFDGQIYTADNEYETYFVVYLVVDRSSGINLTPEAKDNVSLSAESGEGYDETFVKTYNAEEIIFGLSVQVLGDDSSNGDILNVRAILSTTPDYESDAKAQSYLRSVKEKGGEIKVLNEWIDIPEINLIHANEFYITYIINYNDQLEASMSGYEPTYNNNYITLTKVIKVIIGKKTLFTQLVALNPDDMTESPSDRSYYSYKYFGQKNSDVEDRYIVVYDGWAGDDGGNADIVGSIISPTVNWSAAKLSSNDDVDGIKVSAGKYSICATGGQEPTTVLYVNGVRVEYVDYEFSYTASLPFEIKKLRLNLNGEYPTVIINESTPYVGGNVKPTVERYGWDGSNLSVGIDATAKINITYIGKIVNYDPSKTDYTPSDTQDTYGTYANVGYYLFLIEVGDSTNYDGIAEFYWVFEIEKRELILDFVVSKTDTTVDRGFSKTTYSGTTSNYPSFIVTYSGFQGDDNSSLTQGAQTVQFKKEDYNASYAGGINFVGLVNPLYVFVDQEGNELLDADGKPYMPVSAGQYYIKLLISEGEYGYAQNYQIVVRYAEEDGKTLYPIMEITKRPVTVSYKDGNIKITKEYDGTDVVIANSVQVKSNSYVGNYTFNQGSVSDNFGLVDGDYIALSINYGASRYARKEVYDEFEIMSDIDVYLSVEGTLVGDDADNYYLDIDGSSTYVENGENYIKLVGTITPARANVRFLDKDGQSVNILRVTYNGEQQPAIVDVIGVNGEILTYDNGDYTVWYSSEKSNWDSDIAPTNCDYYEVLVTIKNKNYSESPQTGYLEIMQAEVSINFGGEGMQMYGNVTTGLTAVASGVHGYSTVLGVDYYYISDDGTQGGRVSDISVAPAGTYIAEAIHVATDNFLYKRATETFTILRRDTAINYDVSPRYEYTGKPVSIKMYFIDSGETHYPQLIFDRLINGVWVPDNYVLASDGSVTNITANPSGAGEYRVKAYEILDNYYVTDPVWCYFTVDKASLVIQIKDMTINENVTQQPTATMVGCLTEESINSVVTNLEYKYYTLTGEELSAQPKTPGMYKILGYGADARNYNITYTFGILNVNKSSITASTNENNKDLSVELEGSFSSKTEVVVSKVQNSEYSDMTENFNSYTALNEGFEGKILQDIYVFNYDNHTPSAEGMTIRIYMPNFFANFESETSLYQVAVLLDDGSLNVINGTKDDDYLVIETEQQNVKAVSVVVNAVIESSNGYDWLFYVGIAIAVLLIILAIVIVVKKA